MRDAFLASAFQPVPVVGRAVPPPMACLVDGTESTETVALPRRLSRLASVLHASPDVRTQSLRLVRIGAALPRASVLDFDDRTRVPGCISVVHICVRIADDGRLRLSGAADSKVARGLVSLLVRGLQGETPEVLERLDVTQLAAASGLVQALTPGRLNGLGAMLDTIRKQLRWKQQLLSPSAQQADVPQAPTEVAAPQIVASANPRLLWPAAEEEVAVLLSGGVDSSVAMHQLLKAGYRCRAFYLRIWLEDEQVHAARGACPWEEDWSYCRAVCEQANVPLEAISLQQEYQEHVVGYLVDEAAAGRTPNPDIMCNSRIKFGVFHDRIGSHFAHVASGHYAQTARAPAVAHAGLDGSSSLEQPVQLLRSIDAHKDQTYFLSQLRQDQLRNTLFPIGGLSKPQVRAAAHALHLPNRERKDSQGICFLGQLNYDDFLRDHLGERPGPIVEFETGQTIGTHRGLWFHTVGQRRGIGPVLSNAFRAFGPWHVVSKDFEANVLYATRSYRGADKARNSFRADAINWVAGHPPPTPSSGAMQLQVKVRHGAQTHNAEVALHHGGSGAHVKLSERDKGLAPGQFAAFYDGEICLGSGVITDGAI